MNRTFSDSPNFQKENFMDMITISNKASGGAIGTAIDTVDQYQGAYLTQTTASQTITLPSPTGDVAKVFVLGNSGSVSFTFDQKTIYPGTCVVCIYCPISITNQGKKWMVVGASATLTTTTTTTA